MAQGIKNENGELVKNKETFDKELENYISEINLMKDKIDNL